MYSCPQDGIRFTNKVIKVMFYSFSVCSCAFNEYRFRHSHSVVILTFIWFDLIKKVSVSRDFGQVSLKSQQK